MSEKKACDQPRGGKPDGILIVGLLSLALCCLPGWGLWCFTADAVRQHRMLTTYQPAEATTTRSEGGPMANSRSGMARLLEVVPDEVVGRPWYTSIHYAYRVDGNRYTGFQVDPPGLGGDSSSSEAWARQIVADHAPGQRCQVWYDPDDPARSFLVKEPLFRPYLFILVCLLLTCLLAAIPGGCLVLTARWLFNPSAGWHPPEEATPLVLKAWGVALVGVYLVGTLLALGHYFLYASRPFARDGEFVVSGLVLACAPLAFGLYQFLKTRLRAKAPAAVAVQGRDTRHERREKRRVERQAKKVARRQRR